MSESQTQTRKTSASNISEAAIQETRNELLANPALNSAVVLAQSDTWVTPFVSLLVDEPALRGLIAAPQIIGIGEVQDIAAPLSPVEPPPTGIASGPRVQLIEGGA